MRKILVLGLILSISMLAIVSILLRSSGQPEKDKAFSDRSDQDKTSEEQLPVRGFLIGVSGYVPAQMDSPTATNVLAFWKEVPQMGELYGVHTDWKDLEIIELASSLSGDADLTLVLGYQSPHEWNREVADQVIQEISHILSRHKRVKYVGIGNEVNLLKERHPTQFDDFISQYRYIYDSLKESFPTVNFYTTFQYESLIGEGYLMGGSELREPDWELVQSLDGELDLYVFTSYPFFDFTQPDRIPAHYYKPIRDNLGTGKKIGFSEIGWLTQENFIGEFKPLSDQGYGGSDQEQREFLIRFEQLVSNIDVQFVQWAFLHDIANWREGVVPPQKDLALFSSIGLKEYSGKPKPAYEQWLIIRDKQ